jgi:predicted nuclease of predicted toxin-antitoxin system
MRFLLDADLPRSASDTVRQRGHEAIDVRDIGLRDAKDAQIARHAQKEELCLLTADQDFTDIRNYPPSRYSGIVVLSLPRDATSAYVNKLLDSFLEQETILTQLPGKLAIVEPGRVRLRNG